MESSLHNGFPYFYKSATNLNNHRYLSFSNTSGFTSSNSFNDISIYDTWGIRESIDDTDTLSYCSQLPNDLGDCEDPTLCQEWTSSSHADTCDELDDLFDTDLNVNDYFWSFWTFISLIILMIFCIPCFPCNKYCRQNTFDAMSQEAYHDILLQRGYKPDHVAIGMFVCFVLFCLCVLL